MYIFQPPRHFPPSNLPFVNYISLPRGISSRILVTFKRFEGRSLLLLSFHRVATGQDRRVSCMHSALARKRRGTLPP